MTVTRAVWGFLEERDLRLMRRVNRWRAPRWVRLSMLWVTRLGDGWLWYALGLLLCFFGGPQRYRAVAAEGIAALAAIIVFRALKTMSRRSRPCRIERHCWAVIAPPDEYSFPSGHTMTAFAISIALGHFYPDCLPYLLFVAASIGASRIILGMHFLTDVVVGAAIGLLLGYVCVFPLL